MRTPLEKGKANLAEALEAASEVTSEIAQRESELKLAEQEFNRSRNLLTRKVISREEYDQQASKRTKAKAVLTGAKAKLRTANQSLSAADVEVKRTEVKIL